MTAQPETRLCRRIMEALRAQGAKVIKTHPAGVEVGTPDLIGCLPPHGRLFALEVKVPGGKHPVSPAQAHRLEQWTAAGAVACVVESVEDALRAVGVNTSEV